MKKVLLTIPHVFSPRNNSLYSSQNEEKRSIKTKALNKATLENLIRHRSDYFIHASLGKGKEVVTRKLMSSLGVDLTIQLITPKTENLTNTLSKNTSLEEHHPSCKDYMNMPLIASRKLLEQSSDFDLVGYMEDDILIEDPDFFEKIIYLVNSTSQDYVFLPHRCESIHNKGEVILSGDPDGGRPDLFWDTNEKLEIQWPLGKRIFYRATNPHSGCFFLTRAQGLLALKYWQEHNWQAKFQLAGPLEQACSGILLPIFKLMKPIPDHYRFLMVRHQDQLWKRHPFEELLGSDSVQSF